MNDEYKGLQVASHSDKLELISNVKSGTLDIWALVNLFYLKDDPEVLEIICNKLYAFEPKDLTFFLAQLCNLMLNRKQGSHPLSRLLIDKSRASLSFGLLVYFIVHATLEGSDDDEKSARCETLLMELEAAVLDGYRNVDLAMIEAFNTHNRQYRINKGYASLDDTDIIFIQTESSVRKTAYNIYEHLEVHTEDLMPDVTPLTVHDMNNLRQLCSEVLNITQPETLLKLRRSSVSELAPPSLNQSFSEVTNNNTNRSSNEDASANTEDKELKSSSVDSLNDPNQHHIDLNDSDPMIAYEKKLLAIEGLHLGLREPKTRDAKVKIANEQRGIVIGGRHRSVSDASMLLNEAHADQSAVNNNTTQPRASNTLYSTVAAKECLFDYFHAEMKFINALTGVSAMLKDLGLKKKELKNAALKVAIKKLNRQFPRGVFIPICGKNSDEYYRVLRIPFEEAFVLNSRDRVPFILFIEVASGTSKNPEDLACEMHTESEETPEESREIAQLQQLHDEAMKKQAEEERQKEESSTASGEQSSTEQTITVTEEFTVKRLDKFEIMDEWVVVQPPSDQPVQPKAIKDAFGELWEDKKKRLRKESPVGSHSGWDMISVIVKSGDDLRQEQFATQLIKLFDDVFRKSGLPLWLRTYTVLGTSSEAGLIETVPDSISIHSLKERLNITSLRSYYIAAYGDAESLTFIEAQRNFVESLAAYSLVCYFLQIKDRHNGNILIDKDGHLIHIDYGFMLSSSPGKFNFEKVPFKFPRDFVEVMGGKNSSMFMYFKTLFSKGFLEMRKNYRKLVDLVAMMLPGTKMACFMAGAATIEKLEDRFKLQLSEPEAIVYADSLVLESLENWRTDLYDNFQYYSNDIK